MIVVIAGKKHAGKTELANLLQQHIGGQVFNFADELKSYIVDFFGIDKDFLYNQSLKERYIVNINGKFTTPRKIMQSFSLYVKNVDQKCFANTVVRDIRNNTDKNSYVGDARYDFELDVLEENFSDIITVYLKRGNNNDADQSENGWSDMSRFDLIIDNNKLSIYGAADIVSAYMRHYNLKTTPKPLIDIPQQNIVISNGYMCINDNVLTIDDYLDKYEHMLAFQLVSE